MHRQRASERLARNQRQQDETVNAGRKSPRSFECNSLVFVIKQAQSTGKLDSGMRGPYRVVKALPHGRYELQLLAGSYGKSTQAAAQFMKPWRGEWTPETCAAYFDGADSNDDNAESTPEQAANVDTQPTIDTSPEPMPSTSRAAEALQPQPQENGDVLQSGEAVLAEE
ncbi:hypothetical protein HF086_003230 [Spodoptera exigua]|uniref:Uncharacterized protein n=1 Tax=Spodoptera exigua TaxID=7107 RepID=A0A922MIH5_SPOEX|nr:hypothetical protein HF086_003230 [Spodoptera exigua]